MTRRSSISTMLAHSRQVLTERNVEAFERVEKEGTLLDAIVYVAIAAALSSLFSLVLGPGAFLSTLVSTVLGFVVFVYIVHWWGTQRGGTGTVDEVAYSFALFWAPLAVLLGVVSLALAITIVGIVLIPVAFLAFLVLDVWFAYMATQASLNLTPGWPTWSVLLVAALASFLVNGVISAILA